MSRAVQCFLMLGLATACSGAARREIVAGKPGSALVEQPVGPASSPDDPRGEALARAVDALRRKDGLVGLSVAVLDHDALVLLRGFGSQDVAGAASVTGDTPFFIASITKTFTSVLAAMAVDDGKLSFDLRPRDLVPRFRLRDPDADARATLRDLLAHRSGLGTEAGEMAASFEGLGLEGLLAVVAEAKPTAKLRERYQYSNAGFAIAGEMVARAEETSYSALLDARILGPLGMRDTALVTSASPDAAQQLVPGYLGDSVPGAMRDGEGSGARRLASVTGWIDSDVMAPAGGLRSTARDMAQWVRLLNGHGSSNGRRLVRRETFDELVTPQIEPSPGQGIGLDFVLQTWRGHRVAYHGGALLGADALLAFLPDDGVGFVALSNTLAPDVTSELRGQLIRTIFAALVPAPPPPAPRSPAPPAPLPPTWRPTPAGSPTVEELMARTIAALGGEANLRRHHSWESIEDATLETQGVRAQLHTLAAAPARFRCERDVFAAGRLLGTARRWFDGTDTYVADGASMDKPVRLPASLTEGAREENDFYREISWKTLWEAVTLRGMSDVDGVPAFVLEKRAASGFTVTDFVSTRTSLPLRHESSAGSVTYADWRWVDRVRVPFTRVVREEDPLGAGGDSTVHVREVRFDAQTAEEMFRPPTP